MQVLVAKGMEGKAYQGLFVISANLLKRSSNGLHMFFLFPLWPLTERDAWNPVELLSPKLWTQ